MIRLPRQDTKKWVTSFKGDYLGNITNSMGIDLFSSPGKVKLGSKVYPHTTGTVSGSTMTPPGDMVAASIYDGAARTLKTWAVMDDKVLMRSLSGAAFVKDTATGFTAAENTGDYSDLLSVGDDTEDSLIVTELSIAQGDGAFRITGSGNNTKWAQSFTQVQGPFKKLSLYIRQNGTVTDDIVIQIQSDTAGVPSGTTLTSLTLDGGQFSDSFTLYEYEAEDWTDSTVQFDLDATYHLVFSRSGSADTSNFLEFRLAFGEVDPDVPADEDPNNPYKHGSLQQYNGSTWTRTDTYVRTDTFTDDGIWTVPSGVTQATVEVWGAGAAGTTNVGGGGGGAYSKSVITVAAAETHGIVVGQASTNRDDGYGSAFNGIEVLAVGGGGAGGAGNGTRPGGGGGAGGFVEKCLALGVDTYAVVIGAGGSSSGDAGNNTTFDTSLIVALGGGGGGTAGGNGDNGGSGGGASQASASAGTGTPGQGYNGGAGLDTDEGGGGGGASEAGSNGAAEVGGAGGDGKVSTISGASVTYAGGGGGGCENTGVGGAGGAGGGGAGSATTHGTAGTANTGGGGGGGASAAPGNGGAGGSGIVIVRYLTGKYTATGGTITTSGGYTIHTFTSNGTFEITAINDDRVIAYGGLNGYNGGTGGQASDGVGDTKYSGGDGFIGTGEAGGGGGAGDLFAGNDAIDEFGGAGGGTQGGNGGGTLNSTTVSTGGLYSAGGMSQAGSQYEGARGEVRISYTVPIVANYPNVIERFFGTSSTGTSHSINFPSTVLPGDTLVLVISADGAATASKTGWDVISSKVATSSNCAQTILHKVATGDDDGIFTLSTTTSLSYIGYRIKNGDTPTATQETAGTMDPPEHDTFELAKYLWIAAGTMVSSSQPNQNPTAGPTNYTSFIIQPEKYNFDEQALKGARTAVAERQLEASSENPSAFTGSGDGFAVAGTIAIPYKAQDQYIDASLQLQLEFPEAEERLYVTTTKDIKFLNAENGIWQSLWMGIYQQDALDSNFPHPLKDLGAGGVLFVGDGHKLHSMIANGVSVTEANPNRLVFDSTHYINWIQVTKSAVFIGLANKKSQDLPSKICYYEPNSEISRIFTIKEGATVGFTVDENCYIIDRAGQMRYYNGSAFPAMDYFPPYYNDQKMNLPHRNGIFVKNGDIHILWEGQYPYAAGIWVYDDGRLYHKHPFVYDGVNLNSYGAMDVPTGWRSLYDNGTNIYAGARLYGTDNSTEVKGVFSPTKASGVTVESEGRGYLRTARYTSKERDSIWQRIFSKVDDRPAGVVNGSLVMKYRQEASPIGEGYDAPSYAGTWTAATTFTTTDAAFKTAVDAGTIEAGDEVIVRRGQGSGLRLIIVSITGTTTRTVTVTGGLSDITSGSMTFSVENWKLITNRNLVGSTSEWLQLKPEIRDSVELEEIQITSKTNQTNEE